MFGFQHLTVITPNGCKYYHVQFYTVIAQRYIIMYSINISGCSFKVIIITNIFVFIFFLKYANVLQLVSYPGNKVQFCVYPIQYIPCLSSSKGSHDLEAEISVEYSQSANIVTKV